MNPKKELIKLAKKSEYRVELIPLTPMDKMFLKHSNDSKKEIKRYKLHYDRMTISVYYDTAGLLGFEGNPYFEFHIIKNPYNSFSDFEDYWDPIRFDDNQIHDSEELLLILKDKYNKLKKQYPEYLI